MSMLPSGDLFGFDPTANLLPRDGRVHYFGPIMEASLAEHYERQLLTTLPWKHDEAVMHGKHIVTARKIVWVGDARFDYTYSGTTKQAIPWTQELRELKSRIEGLTETSFNSCLLNLYHHGGEGMSWHSDDESALGKHTTIASLSLGAARKFAFRHKRTKESITLTLEPGSLLLMQGTTQSHWQHSLPKSAGIQMPRINLTFRTIVVRDVA